MTNLKDLYERREKLNTAILKAKKILSNDVKGSLDISTRGDRFCYYNVKREKGQKKKQYIKLDQINLAQKIVNRDYATQIQTLAQKEADLLTQLIDFYQGNYAEICHENLHPGRKVLAQPLLLSDNEYADIWLNQRSKQKNSYEISSELYSENNEQVRSKSEKIIADKLFFEKIPYKYEEALKINGKIFFPDFTILKKSTRDVFYWEHFGLIDQEDYQFNMMRKVNMYARNGIVLGKNLIITFETKDCPLSSATVEAIISEVF